MFDEKSLCVATLCVIMATIDICCIVCSMNVAISGRRRPSPTPSPTLSHLWIIHLEHHYISLSALLKCLTRPRQWRRVRTHQSVCCNVAVCRLVWNAQKNSSSDKSSFNINVTFIMSNVYMYIFLTWFLCGHLLRWSSCTSGCSLSLWSHRTWARPTRPAGSSSAPAS